MSDELVSSIQDAKRLYNQLVEYDSKRWSADIWRGALIGAAAAREIAADVKQQSASRVGAARLLLELAGLIGAGRDARSQDKDPSTMSTAELRAEIQRLDRAVSDRAAVVAPTVPTLDHELFDK